MKKTNICRYFIVFWMNKESYMVKMEAPSTVNKYSSYNWKVKYKLLSHQPQLIF